MAKAGKDPTADWPRRDACNCKRHRGTPPITDYGHIKCHARSTNQLKPDLDWEQLSFFARDRQLRQDSPSTTESPLPPSPHKSRPPVFRHVRKGLLALRPAHWRHPQCRHKDTNGASADASLCSESRPERRSARHVLTPSSLTIRDSPLHPHPLPKPLRLNGRPQSLHRPPPRSPSALVLGTTTHTVAMPMP